MQLMERVRDIGAAEARIEDGHVAVAREILRNEMRKERTRARTRRRRRVGIGIGAGGLVAAGTAAVLVVGAVLTPTESAEALEQAASAAAQDAFGDVPSGSYLRVSTETDLLVLWDEDQQDGRHFNIGDLAEAEAALVRRGTTDLFVPGDRSDEWIQVSHPRAKVVDQFGDAERALEDLQQRPGGDSPRRFVVAPGGAYEDAGAFGETNHTYYLDSRQSWDEMPRDASEYLAYARARVGEPADSDASDSSIVEQLVDNLNDVAAPADLRATWWRALALLDGSTVVSEEGDVATIRFEWSTEWWTASHTIEVDTARGVILSEENSTVDTGEEPSLNGLPEWNARTTYTYDVVDSAPTE